jgi:hypothetical protein
MFEDSGNAKEWAIGEGWCLVDIVLPKEKLPTNT